MRVITSASPSARACIAAGLALLTALAALALARPASVAADAVEVIGLPGPDPVLCDPLAGSSCGPGAFCRLEPGDCTSPQGLCMPRPEGCTTDWIPVCGCDGETYSNACGADAAGVSIDYQGECEAKCDQLCEAGTQCFSAEGVFVEGVECPLLFETDAGALYIVDAPGASRGQRVSLSGCLDPDCVSICQEGDGCILHAVVPEPRQALLQLALLLAFGLARRCRGAHGRWGAARLRS